MQMIPPEVVVFCDPTLTALLQRLNAPSRHAIGAPVAVLSAPAALMLGQMARGARNDVLFPLAAAMDQEVRQKLVKPETRVDGWNNPLVLAVAAGRQARPAAEFDRRQFLRRGMSLGALTLLTGCDVSDSRAVQAMFGYVDRWNNLVQEALFSPTKLAPEYPEHMAVKDFRYNAWYEPALAPRLDPNDYKLELSGLIEKNTLVQQPALPVRTAITKASTWRPRCTRRPSWRSNFPMPHCRCSMAFHSRCESRPSWASRIPNGSPRST